MRPDHQGQKRGVPRMNALECLDFERREMVALGQTTVRDIENYPNGELVAMALCYIALARKQSGEPPSRLDTSRPRGWPSNVDEQLWKPSGLAKTNVMRAMGLLAAEWDRLHATGA